MPPRQLSGRDVWGWTARAFFLACVVASITTHAFRVGVRTERERAMEEIAAYAEALSGACSTPGPGLALNGLEAPRALSAENVGPSRAELKEAALWAAAAEGVPFRYVSAVVFRESSWRVDAIGSAGEIGLGQLKPATARELGVDPWDWRQNLRGVARNLRRHHARFRNWPDALAAYNRGARGYAHPKGRAYAARVLRTARADD